MRLSSLAAVLATVSAALLAQTPREPAISELLQEVRQLRVAVERAALTLPLLQVTLHRMMLQQNEVSAAARELEQAQQQVRYYSQRQSMAALEIARLTKEHSDEQEDRRKKALEGQIRYARVEAGQLPALDADARALESEKSARLRSEQAKLELLVARLSALEKQMEIEPAKPRP